MIHLLRPKSPHLYKELGGEALDHLLIIPPRFGWRAHILLYLISNASIFIVYTSTSSYMDLVHLPHTIIACCIFKNIIIDRNL